MTDYGTIKRKKITKDGKTFDSLFEFEVYKKLRNSNLINDIELHPQALIYPSFPPYKAKSWKIDFNGVTEKGLVFVEAKGIINTRLQRDLMFLRAFNESVFKSLLIVLPRQYMEKHYKQVRALHVPCVSLEYFNSSLPVALQLLTPITSYSRQTSLFR